MLLLSSRTLERQSPVWFGPLKVSPKATWMFPVRPFSHMTPTSVPQMLKPAVLLVCGQLAPG